MSIDLPEEVFAQVRPARLVQGGVGGGTPAPKGQVEPTHDLRYALLEFREPVSEKMPWFSRAKTCGSPVTFDGRTGWAFRAKSFANQGVQAFPGMVPARLFVSGRQVLYLEFSGTVWPTGEVTRATRKFLQSWSSGQSA